MMEAFSYGFDSMLAGYQRFENDTLAATKHFVRLGLVELQERDAANNITAEYAWNFYRPGGIGGLLTTKQGTSKYHYLYNHLGHVMAMVDGKGKRVSGYNYSPYGIVSGSDFSQQPFGYSTKRSDFASGLVNFGYRFYMPNLGRWLNRDPLEEIGGINLYAYVKGDPLGYVDPNGLTACHVDFRGYPIPLGHGVKLDLGHSGVVAFDDSGHAQYAEYGRYPGNLPVPDGNVRFGDLEDLDMGDDGWPTPDSWEKLKEELAKEHGKDIIPTLTCADVDEDKVMDYARKLSDNLGRDKYDPKFNKNTCKTFVGKAIMAGSQ